MNEDEFDALIQGRQFRSEDAGQWDSQLRRITGLGIKLWGRAPEDLQRQLMRPYPEIPAGFELSEFRELQRSIDTISKSLASARSGDRRFAWLPAHYLDKGPVIDVGNEQFTTWEARAEILRRAIEFLEQRP